MAGGKISERVAAGEVADADAFEDGLHAMGARGTTSKAIPFGTVMAEYLLGLVGGTPGIAVWTDYMSGTSVVKWMTSFFTGTLYDVQTQTHAATFAVDFGISGNATSHVQRFPITSSFSGAIAVSFAAVTGLKMIGKTVWLIFENSGGGARTFSIVTGGVTIATAPDIVAPPLTTLTGDKVIAEVWFETGTKAWVLSYQPLY